jgi:integrase
LHLGYRRNAVGGKWVLRCYLGGERYVTETLGLADDALPAEGHVVRSYPQAAAVAGQRFVELRRQASGLPCAGIATIADVLDAYARAQAAAGKGGADLSWRLRALKADLGSLPIPKLTTGALQAWRDGRVAKRQPKPDEDPREAARRARASANRLWTVLAAALNHGHRTGAIPTADPWQRVRRLPDAAATRDRFLTTAEAARLIRACEGGFRDLVAVALATGMRYGELANLRVHDFNFDTSTLFVSRSKSGRSRHVHLSDEGRDLVVTIVAGRAGDEPLLRKDDGSHWRKGQQLVPMAQACKRANIAPACGFHQLRHTYCSLAVMNGMPLQVVAKNAGHVSVAITEKHYAHLAPSYMSQEIKSRAPTFGIEPSNLAVLRR